MKRILALILACTLAVLPMGCNHISRIVIEPEGVKASIYVNDVLLAEDAEEVIFNSRSGIPDRAYVKIEAKGYKTIKGIIIKKAYRADLSLLLLIPGIVPYFFTARYEDDYKYILQKVEPEDDKAKTPAKKPAEEQPEQD